MSSNMCELQLHLYPSHSHLNLSVVYTMGKHPGKGILGNAVQQARLKDSQANIPSFQLS